MKGCFRSRRCGAAAAEGFTLIEMLVSTALLALLAVVMVSVVNQTSETWKFTTTKVEEFRTARDGFESLTRQLSQATLNTYWDYKFSGTGSTATPTKYIRQSDLRFISGSAQTVTNALIPVRPTHAVFFQAPLGYADPPNFVGMGNLMNTWGYFVEFNTDKPLRPSFLNQLQPPLAERYRFRLIELMQPSNDLNIYNLTRVVQGKPDYTGLEWITVPLIAPKTETHVLAENVIALILLPKLAPEEDTTGTKLAPAYTYDSTVTNSDPSIDSKNQLPPLMQVTLVALGETSAARIANGTVAPVLGLETLFQTSNPNSAQQFTADLATLQTTLANQRLNFRVFTTTVSIRAAKWSRN